MRWYALAWIVLFPVTALAQAPFPVQNPEKFMRIGGVQLGWDHTVPVTTRTVIGNQYADTGIESDKCFDWGSVVNIGCAAQTIFCWTMTATVTIRTGGYIDDEPTTVDGQGHCFRVEAGTYRDTTEFQANFQATTEVGRRAGYCSGNSVTALWPCRVNGDCSTGGTCNTTRTQEGNVTRDAFSTSKCAFLVSIAPVATSCWITLER